MHDIVNAIKNETTLLKNQRHLLFKMLNRKTVFQSYSEYNPKHYSAMENIKNKAVHLKFKTSDSMRDGVKRMGREDATYVYINGILTAEGVAKYQQHYLEKVLGGDVELFYNYTGGALVDLYESFLDRNDMCTVATKNTVSFLVEKLERQDEIVILAHSQGAIISYYALLLIAKERPELLQKVRLITFGAALKEFTKKLDVERYHFANTHDPVSRLGLFDCNEEIITRDAHGHLFIADYIYPIWNGEFGEKKMALFFRS